MMAHFCSTLFDRASAQLSWLWCIGAGAALLAYRRWRSAAGVPLLAHRAPGAALLSSSHRTPASTGAAASMLNPNW
jgi:hypothetical protein